MDVVVHLYKKVTSETSVGLFSQLLFTLVSYLPFVICKRVSVNMINEVDDKTYREGRRSDPTRLSISLTSGHRPSVWGFTCLMTLVSLPGT